MSVLAPRIKCPQPHSLAITPHPSRGKGTGSDLIIGIISLYFKRLNHSQTLALDY